VRLVTARPLSMASLSLRHRAPKGLGLAVTIAWRGPASADPGGAGADAHCRRAALNRQGAAPLK